MAVALDADQEALTYFSFPIEKQEDSDSINPVDGTPDVWIWGKATDGTVDADRQIVDPDWSAVALKEWLATGGNVRMSHDPKRPVGKGHDVQVTMDGHYVKSLICDPLAKHFVRTKVLNDYSVGISLPDIRFGPNKTLDPYGKATGGIITGRQDGLSKIAELSICDRGANFGSRFEMVRKSAGGGAEFTGQMVGDTDEIAKAAPPDLLAKVTGGGLLTKGAGADTWTAPPPVDISSFQMPEDLSITFTPGDMARLVKNKIIEQHYDELALKAVVVAEQAVYKRDIDTATRRRLAADGKALPNLSYPIENAGDLGNAATLARSGHGDVAAARRLIARRARELGVANPLDESDSEKVTKTETMEVSEGVGGDAAPEPVAEKADTPEVVKEAEPEVTKDPEPEPKDKPVKKAKKPKKMPPWLNKPKGDDDGDSDDSKGSDDDKDDDSSKSAAPEACKTLNSHDWTVAEDGLVVTCSKCHTTPAQAAGAAGSHDMSPAPVKELQESNGPASTKSATPASASGAVAESMNPVPAHREPDGAPMEAMERTAKLSDGDDEKPTRLEAATGMKGTAADLAPDPELAALMRFKTLGIDEDLGRLHDLTCPAYHPDQVAAYHPYATLPGLIDSGAWQRKTLAAAAGPLEKALEMAELWQAVHVLKNADQAALNDWRLELHKAFRDANPGPGSFPTPGSVSPQRYHRPVLTDGRAANAVNYGSPNTAPQVATTPPNAQNFDRPPLSSGHQSPSPSFMKGGGAEYPSERGVPQRISYEQVERDKARRSLSMLHDHLNHMFPSVCTMLDQDAYRQPESRPVPQPAGIGKAIDPEPAPAPEAPAAAFKADPDDTGLFMDADIYKGFKKMRKKLGKKVLAGKITRDQALSQLGQHFSQKSAEVPQEAVEKAGDVPVVKSAVRPVVTAIAPAPAAPPVAASLDPEVIKAAVAEATAPLKDLLTKQQEDFTTKLAEQQRVIDAIADQPDPSTAAFSGLAFQPGIQKSRRPAAVPDQAEFAARAQEMVRRNLTHTYQTHSDPHVREAASSALANLGVGTEAPPMT